VVSFGQLNGRRCRLGVVVDREGSPKDLRPYGQNLPRALMYRYGMRDPVRIALIGDFDRSKPSHWATEAALFHAATRLQIPVQPRWIPTPALSAVDGVPDALAGYDGVWGAPGSPFASADGMLNAIAYARRQRVPYLGTCAGFQYALIELSRNVLDLADADSAENNPSSANLVITPVACPLPGRQAGKPKMSGADGVRVTAGTRLAGLCGGTDLSEEYFCNFETNPAFIPRWQAQAGLCIAARGDGGEMRAFELDDHPFFVATLFQPQLSSSADRPHPIIEGYVRALSARDRATR
jgi:CTP synthase (UTP-ammonia lyase)